MHDDLFPPAVLSKEQNYRLWKAGMYGNRLRTWRTHEEYLASGFGGHIVLRYLGAAGGGWCRYNVPPERVRDVLAEFVGEGADPKLVMYNEAAPDKKVRVQGELWNGGDQWNHFFHSFARMHMRPALITAPQTSSGLRTEHLLRSNMTPSSYEDLNVLRERFLDHVFEISIYDVCLGDTPGRNSLVWEIRRY